ncbi:MAG TPA: helix-turn-helix domain-containing protein, partial [Firmicutes bacterium]|nr:helix-turn-helix domain-containing protein [Bacillota bacterium]
SMKSIYKHYCQLCDRRVPVKIEKRQETYPVKGEPTEITATVSVCINCGTACYDTELDSDNLLRAFDKYRLKHNIISPEEIKEIRERYNLSQRGFARLLGLGEVTITRYEQGALPDQAHNLLLKLMKRDLNFKLVYKENKLRLTTRMRKKVESVLQVK